MLRVCSTCTTRYAYGLTRCPHCGTPDEANHTEGDVMPKNTRHGGSSNADGPQVESPTDPGFDGATDGEPAPVASAAGEGPEPDPEQVAPAPADSDGGGEDGAGGSAAAATRPDSGDVEVGAGVAEATGDMTGVPAESATKAEWVAYAVDRLGLTQDQADAMTKAALIDAARAGS